jgi:hypothetical protein
VLIVSKILIAISLVGLLRCSEKFRTSSREFDERVLASLKRMTQATEEHGFPAELGPMLIILSALCFMLTQFR